MFLDLTPKEFHEALREREKYDGYTVKAVIRAICETLRTQTVHFVNVQGANIRDPKKLMRFAWDEDDKVQSLEDMKKMLKVIVTSTRKKEGVTDSRKKRRRNGK